MPLALHAPLPLPCSPQGARLGPWPFPVLLLLSWQLLAQLQTDTVLVRSPLWAGWLICFSPGPRSPGKGMLHGSPALWPRSMVSTTMLTLELEGVCHSWAAPLLPGSSVLGQGCSLHIPEWVRTSAVSLSPLPCSCVLGAGDPALFPCWGPAHDNPSATPQTAAVASCPSCLPGVSVPHAPHPAAPLGLAAPPAQRGPAVGWQCLLMASPVRQLLQGLGTASYQSALCYCHPGAIDASPNPHPPVRLH